MSPRPKLKSASTTTSGRRRMYSHGAAPKMVQVRVGATRAPRLFAILLAGLLFLAAPAGAAWAHDSLAGTSPKDGQSLTRVPAKVTLTFSNPPIALGSQIVVADSDGTNWADGPVQIVDTVVTQKIKPDAPAGKYTVTWRVVSADSHPVDGTFTFSAARGGGAGGENLGSPAPLASPSSPPVHESVPNQRAVPWSIVGMIAVLVALVVIIGVLARRRLTRGDDDGGTDSGGGEAGGTRPADKGDSGDGDSGDGDSGGGDSGGGDRPGSS